MQILGEAIEREPESRDGWVDTVCAGDEALRAEVARLLARQKPAAQFLEESPLAAVSESNGRSMIGERVGLYKIISEIGRGGMGAVYLAERDDQQFAKRAAVKLIKRGMDTDFVVQRFRNERQILANLDHPNIARLLDGGATEADLPYFVMEYVEGAPIIKYANANKLSTTERLRLFRTVCSAVQYAHQNLVIHRDLKPSNILVTKDGEPKLLDFGIAKLLQLDDGVETDLTATAVRVMTPEYASPEQVKGERITTASDVYSLGVLLYELLTGKRPYRVKSRKPEEIARAIGEQEPEKPSVAGRRGDGVTERSGENEISGNQARSVSPHPPFSPSQLRGDLDNIVLMALRKEPQRRYASVDQFSEDIRRHLEGLPVSARKATFSYRTFRFIQRNKLGVAAAAVVLLILIGGIIATTWEAHIARAERARAERRFDDVRTLVNSRLFELHNEIEKLPGSTRARELLVQQTLDYLDSVSREASGDAMLQREIAAGYEKLGDVQSRLNSPNLGDTKGAFASYQKALEIRKALLSLSPNDVPAGLALALAYDRVGDVLSKTNNAEGALDSHRKALELVQNLATRDQMQTRNALGYSYLMVGRARLKIGDLPASLDDFRRSEAIREAIVAENPDDPSARRALVPTYDGIAFVLSLTGKPTEALLYYRKSQSVVEALVAANPLNVNFRRASMDTYEWVAITLGEIGDNQGGLDYHRRALGLCQAELSADPANAQARDDLADIYHEIGNTMTRLGRPKDALDSFRKALDNYQAIADTDPADTNVRRQVYVTYRQMGNAMLLTGNVRGALENYRKALLGFHELSRADPSNAETRYDVALSYSMIGEALATTGDVSGALENYRQALPGFEILVAQSPTNAKTRRELAHTYYDLGMAQSKFASAPNQSEDRWRDARDWYQKSVGIYLDMKSKGTLSSADASKPEEISREIARCDDALKKAGAP